MHPHPDRSPAARLAALPLLFARYVAGQIQDPCWTRLMQALDDAAALAPAERLALAAFFNDACAEMAPGDLKIPASAEVHDLLTMVA